MLAAAMTIENVGMSTTLGTQNTRLGGISIKDYIMKDGKNIKQRSIDYSKVF